mgnify:CR=1 FL=1|jgi:ABC-type nitrate/sulfonate/bicarbonate transport system, permease component
MTQVLTDRPTTGGANQVNPTLALKQRRKARRRQVKVIVLQALLLLTVVLVWEFVSGRYINELMISRPSKVFPTFWEWVKDGTLLENAFSTFRSAVLGLLIGGLVGVTMGVILGQSRFLAEICEPFITALYTMPKQALIPLFIMWVGIGSALGTLTASVIAFFLIFFNTFFGIRDVRQSLVNSVQVMGGSRLDVLFRVRLPSALIWVVAALKLAVPQSVVAVVISEMLAGDHGLGHLVSLHAGMFNSAGTYAALLALLIAGFVVDRTVSWAVKKPLEWKETSNGDV